MDKIRNHVEVTNESLLNKGEAPNLPALINMYCCYIEVGLGSPQFFDKIEKMISKGLK